MNDPASDFLAALQAAGLAPAVSFVPRSEGRLHRYRLHDERPGKRSGWYVLHPGDPPRGHAGDWRTDNRLDWIPTEVNGRPFDREQWEAVVRSRAAVEKRQWDASADRARAIWQRLPPANEDHPYLLAKQVVAGPVRVNHTDRLVVPVFDAASDEMISLQFIAADGSKRFLVSGRIRGGCCLIGPADASRIIICEGYATGATIQAATGDRVACAFSDGNLHAVAEALQKRFPTKRLLLAADNDDKTAGNPGISKAFEASLKLGISWVSPPSPGDFNDLGIAYGHEAVRLVIDAVTDPEAKKQADALFGPNREPLAAAYERLAKLDPGTYDRLRASEAKRLGIRASTLDYEVRKRRGQKQKDGRREGQEEEELSGRRISLFDPQPDAVAIDGASLIDGLKEDLRRYLVLSDEAATVVAFWILFAYTYQAFSHCPRLSIVSPTKNCGKSTLVDWLGAVLPRALVTENLTVAVLFRVVDAHRAIMIIDEADKILLEHTDSGRELLAMLNAGWKRPGLAFRCEGDNHEPRGYSVFGPAVMAGIKERPPQITERSHRVVLSRASNDEFHKLKRFRQDRVKPQQQLAKQCARWALDNIRKLEIADPELPDSLANRAAVNWASFLAIADILGGDWPKKMRSISVKTVDEADDEDAAIQLLKDIRAVFDEKDENSLHSTTIAQALGEMEGQPWGEWGRSGKPISAHAIGRILKPFAIHPVQVWIDGIGNRRGYRRSAFEHIWSVYLDTQTDHTPKGGPDPGSEVLGRYEDNKNNGLNAKNDDSKSLGSGDSSASKSSKSDDNPLKNNNSYHSSTSNRGETGDFGSVDGDVSNQTDLGFSNGRSNKRADDDDPGHSWRGEL